MNALPADAEKSLGEYESKLGLVAKFQKSKDAVKEIDAIIDGVIDVIQKSGGDDEKKASDGIGAKPAEEADLREIISSLRKVKDIIDNLEE